MRMPLTRLRNRMDTLLQRLSSDPAAANEVGACLGEVDGTLAMFNAILRIARIEAGGHGPLVDNVDLTALCHDAVDLYQALAEEREIHLALDLAPAMIQGDRDLLFQMVVNLLDNALKYAHHGGAVRFAIRTDADEVVVTIADDGPGIAEDDRARVFDRFYRVDASRAAPGSGLGLALVKAAADLHQARIVLADNRPGLRVELHFAAQAERVP
jgi:signal transduction histidine kinase